MHSEATLRRKKGNWNSSLLQTEKRGKEGGEKIKENLWIMEKKAGPKKLGTSGTLCSKKRAVYGKHHGQRGGGTVKKHESPTILGT